MLTVQNRNLIIGDTSITLLADLLRAENSSEVKVAFLRVGSWNTTKDHQVDFYFRFLAYHKLVSYFLLIVLIVLAGFS